MTPYSIFFPTVQHLMCVGFLIVCLVCLFVFYNILGVCITQRDAEAATSLSKHTELSRCVLSQRGASGGASRCRQNLAGPPSGG